MLVNIPSVANLLGPEWTLVEQLVSVLAPFERITTLMSGSQYPTISLVIPVLNELKHSLSSVIAAAGDQTIVRELCETLTRYIDSRWPNYERTLPYAISTLLDPTYKDCAFNDQSAPLLGRSYIIDASRMIQTIDERDRTQSQTESAGESSVAG